MTQGKTRTMRDSGLESGWLAEMVAVCGPPEILAPIRHRATRTYEWRWPGVANVRLRVHDPSRRAPESSVLMVSADVQEVDVEVRCATGLPSGAQIRAALVAAGLLTPTGAVPEVAGADTDKPDLSPGIRGLAEEVPCG